MDNLDGLPDYSPPTPGEGTENDTHSGLTFGFRDIDGIIQFRCGSLNNAENLGKTFDINFWPSVCDCTDVQNFANGTGTCI